MGRMRYFKNKYPDFQPGSRVVINYEHWCQKISSLIDSIIAGMPPTFDNCDGGLYVGCPGIVYMLYYVASSEAMGHKKQDYLTRARNYADVSLSYCKSKKCRDPPAAFLLGSGGTYAVCSLLYSDMGLAQAAQEYKTKYLALSSVCQPVNYLSCGSDELLVGRAGYLCGSLLLNRKFGQVHSQIATFNFQATWLFLRVNQLNMNAIHYCITLYFWRG